jgi:phage terminase small subunit
VSLTAKQEAFARLMALGELSASECYRQSYDAKAMSDKAIHANAHKLTKHTQVALRIAELKKPALVAAESRIALNLQSTLFELARIAHCDVRRMYDEHGRMKPIHEMDADTAAAISGVDQLDYFEQGKDGKGAVGVVKKVRLHSKVQALEQLMRHFGGFKEDNEQKAGVLNDLEREQVKALVTALSNHQRKEISGPSTVARAAPRRSNGANR